MEQVRMVMEWQEDAEGRLTAQWVRDPLSTSLVHLDSRRKDLSPRRAVSYVRRAKTAG